MTNQKQDGKSQLNMESQVIEYKQSWRDEFLKEICGFANAQGGILYIGVDDKGTVVGLQHAKKLLEDIPNQSVMTMGVMPNVNLLSKADKEYISIEIKPLEQPISYKGKYYYRSGSTLQELNGSALQDFLLRKIGRSWDDLVCEEATMDDLDADAFEFFIRRAIEVGRMPQEAKDDKPITILKNLNLITPDGKLKNAAVLLFGKNPQYFFCTANFRMARIGRDDTDLIFQEDINGNILQMASKVMWQLRGRYLLTANRYDGMQRIEELELPETALRELIHNAIVHRSYTGFDTQMKVYDDRIWLWNAGSLPQGYSVEQLTTAHLSFPRNKRIAEAFYKAGFIESWGRGIQQVQKAFQNINLPAPVLEDKFGGTSVVIPRNINIKTNHFGTKDGTKDGTKELTDRQKVIIAHLYQDGTINIPDLARKINAGERTIKRDISILQKNGYIERINGRKDGYWQVVYLQ